MINKPENKRQKENEDISSYGHQILYVSMPRCRLRNFCTTFLDNDTSIYKIILTL